jgi:hypothetical protein
MTGAYPRVIFLVSKMTQYLSEVLPEFQGIHHTKEMQNKEGQQTRSQKIKVVPTLTTS